MAIISILFSVAGGLFMGCMLGAVKHKNEPDLKRSYLLWGFIILVASILINIFVKIDKHSKILTCRYNYYQLYSGKAVYSGETTLNDMFIAETKTITGDRNLICSLGTNPNDCPKIIDIKCDTK